MPRRKTRRSFNEPGHAHFLTYSCINRWPLLRSDRACGWVVGALDEARRRHDFAVWAFVIMPEHVHVLIRPRSPIYDIATILAALKRPVSARAKQHLTESGNSEWLDRLTIRRGSRDTFRFWLPGGGYDQNIWRDHAVADVIEYIHANPVRRGLVERPSQWDWSSSKFWESGVPVPLAMDPVEM